MAESLEGQSLDGSSEPQRPIETSSAISSESLMFWDMKASLNVDFRIVDPAAVRLKTA
jgi:hypothetical protein